MRSTRQQPRQQHHQEAQPSINRTHTHTHQKVTNQQKRSERKHFWHFSHTQIDEHSCPVNTSHSDHSFQHFGSSHNCTYTHTQTLSSKWILFLLNFFWINRHHYLPLLFTRMDNRDCIIRMLSAGLSYQTICLKRSQFLRILIIFVLTCGSIHRSMSFIDPHIIRAPVRTETKLLEFPFAVHVTPHKISFKWPWIQLNFRLLTCSLNVLYSHDGFSMLKLSKRAIHVFWAASRSVNVPRLIKSISQCFGRFRRQCDVLLFT